MKLSENAGTPALLSSGCFAVGMEHTADAGLVRGLRRWDLVALVINSIIGAGIFGLPSTVYALAGTYSLLAYVVSAAAIVLIIICFAEGEVLDSL